MNIIGIFFVVFSVSYMIYTNLPRFKTSVLKRGMSEQAFKKYYWFDMSIMIFILIMSIILMFMEI